MSRSRSFLSPVLFFIMAIFIGGCSSSSSTRVEFQTSRGTFAFSKIERLEELPPGCGSSCESVSEGSIGLALFIKATTGDDYEACDQVLDIGQSFYLILPDGRRRSARQSGWDADIGCYLTYVISQANHDFDIYYGRGSMIATVKSDELIPPEVVSGPIPDSGLVFLQTLEAPEGGDAPQGINGIDQVAWSPSGELLAAAGKNGMVYLWQMADRTLIQTLAYGAFHLQFSPDSTMLAAAGSRGTTVWVLSDMENPRTFGDSLTNSVAFAPDGNLLAIQSGTPPNAELWDLASATLVSTLPASVGPIAFSPDGTLLAVISNEDQNTVVRLLRVSDGSVVSTLSAPGRELYGFHPHALAFSNDGTLVAMGGLYGNYDPAGIRLWNVTDGSLMRTFESHSVVTDLSFSPNGRIVASAPNAFLWDATQNAPFNSLGDERTGSVAFSPDGTLIAAGSGTSNNIVYLWQVTESD